MSQPLDEIQGRESVKWTAIALVKQDSVFLPGTTIGATHWVAYAMTRGSFFFTLCFEVSFNCWCFRTRAGYISLKRR